MESHSVIVVGAGLSGVCAAKVLKENGVDVLVLEASNRIGGRLHTVRNENVGYVDVGGAYIGPTQDRVHRLIRDLGLQTYFVHETDSVIHYRKGARTIYGGAFPPMRHPVAFMDCINLFKTMEDLSKQIPMDSPWETPSANELDSMTVKEWYEKTAWTQRVRDTAKVFTNINFTAEPHEVSLLWALWYMKGAGGAHSINSTEGGAQERKIIGGAQQLPEGVATALGDRVILNQPVCKIEYSRGGATVTCTNGNTYQCDHVILALPPALQSRIQFHPSLPALRNQLTQRVPMGSVIKTMMYYKEPYWRQHGMCGSAWIEDDSLDIAIGGAVDDCKPDGKYPAIMGFVLTDKSKKLSELSKEERKVKIAKCYSKVYGLKEMLEPIHYEEKNWNEDPWTGGCYTGWMAPGVLTRYGRVIREPIDCVYFAGTETATVWSGYMEGAIQAGERAAREILYAMNKISKENIWQPEPSQNIPKNDVGFSWVERHLPSVPGFMRLVGLLAAVTTVGGGGYLVSKGKL